jgi:hypothetical protein
MLRQDNAVYDRYDGNCTVRLRQDNAVYDRYDYDGNCTVRLRQDNAVYDRYDYDGNRTVRLRQDNAVYDRYDGNCAESCGSFIFSEWKEEYFQNIEYTHIQNGMFIYQHVSGDVNISTRVREVLIYQHVYM